MWSHVSSPSAPTKGIEYTQGIVKKIKTVLYSEKATVNIQLYSFFFLYKRMFFKLQKTNK